LGCSISCGMTIERIASIDSVGNMDPISSPRLKASTPPALLKPLVPLMENGQTTKGTHERPLKRLRAVASLIEGSADLAGLLASALPGKEGFVPDWLKTLASPSVCVTSLEDVRRLDQADIASLPVPPLVKGVFREILELEAAKAEEQELVLHATKSRKRQFLAPLRDRNMQPPLAGSKYFQDLKNYRLILTHEEIDAGVRIVTRRVETWSKGERIVLIGILKGAFMFMSDLCRTLMRPYSVYFVEASSYGDEKTQKGGVSISSDIPASKFCDSITKQPHKIVLCDELLDNGKTMEEMKQHLLKRLSATHTDNDILTTCLFSKKRDRTYPEADVTGISDLPDLWLVGYGLDDRGTKRGWTELFAIPKVKIVDTFAQEDVDMLMQNLDDSGAVVQPIAFAGVELQYNHKQKYRVFGLDVVVGQVSSGGKSLESGGVCLKSPSKADIQRALASLSKIKGKYEHELRFAFIPDGIHLVPEDEIFSGNNTVYASMRCKLRRQINTDAQRLSVEGSGPVNSE